MSLLAYELIMIPPVVPTVYLNGKVYVTIEDHRKYECYSNKLKKVVQSIRPRMVEPAHIWKSRAVFGKCYVYLDDYLEISNELDVLMIERDKLKSDRDKLKSELDELKLNNISS